MSCVFKVFLNVFRSRSVPDYRNSTFIFLVPKVHFSQSQAFNFQTFSVEADPGRGKKFSGMKQR